MNKEIEEEVLNYKDTCGRFLSLFPGQDVDFYRTLNVMLAYKYKTHDRGELALLTGASLDFIDRCVENIKKNWIAGKEFTSEGKEWGDHDDAGTQIVVINVDILCVLGEITHNPATGLYSAI